MSITLPNLPGFDCEAALKLLANNEKLYVNVLKRFHGQYAGAYEELADAMLNGSDWEAVQREAHTIKGLAGTIGHPELQKAAMELELAAKDNAAAGIDAARDRAREFLSVFSTVLCQLGAAFPA